MCYVSDNGSVGGGILSLFWVKPSSVTDSCQVWDESVEQVILFAGFQV